MSRGHRNCEICGLQEKHCSDKVFFARFPLREHVCKQWVKVVGKEDLALLPIEKLHELRYVCGKHFGKRDFTKTKTRLKKNAVPQLHIKMPPLPDEVLKEFPLHVARRSRAPGGTDVTPLQPLQCQDVNTASATTPATEVASTSEQAIQRMTSECAQNAPATEAVDSTSKQAIQQMALECAQNAPATEAVDSTSKQAIQQMALECAQNAPVEVAPVPVEQSKDKQSVKRIKRKLMDEAELSPRKKKLVDDLRKTKCTLRSLRRSANLIEKIESPILKEIVLNAMKNQKRKPRGRRWTVKNKLSALAVFKRSPRTYRFLNQVLPLPSEKTLQNILKKVPTEPGINQSVLRHLSKMSPNKIEKDKVCCLLFDEMAIKPRLILNTGNDCVEGFEDLGELGRKERIADHALVFMLQGLHHKYKQPIAFYFTKGTISSQNLAVIIKNIITKVSACGFKILNTVCDQGPTNMGALKILREASGPLTDGSNHYFIHNDEKVYVVYDVPHLLKSIRNNFLNYGTISIAGKQGKWAHLLEVEKENKNFLYLSKITETHVNPKYKGKMRVKYAAQILSNTVSAVLKLLSKAENDPSNKEALLQTAQVIADLDMLFDITNGPSGPKDVKKNRRENVSNKSNHLHNWTEFIKKVKTMKFTNNAGKTATNVKCIEGYITTLKSFRDIWQYVSQLGFKYLNLRQLNQDALENLFGLLRQQSPTNRNPTAAHFMSALKAAVITRNFTPSIKGTNCEKDRNFLLTGFENIVFSKGEEEEEEETPESLGNVEEILPQDDEVPVFSIPELPNEQDYKIEDELTKIPGQAVVYVSGYLASRILKNINCQECKRCLSVENPSESIYDYTKFREWWQDKLSLTYPSLSLCKLVQTSTEVTENEIEKKLHEKNITQFAMTMFEVYCDSSWFSCKKHSQTLKQILYKKLALLLIRRACQKVNDKYALQEVSLADTCKKAEQQGKAK